MITGFLWQLPSVHHRIPRQRISSLVNEIMINQSLEKTSPPFGEKINPGRGYRTIQAIKGPRYDNSDVLWFRIPGPPHEWNHYKFSAQMPFSVKNTYVISTVCGIQGCMYHVHGGYSYFLGFCTLGALGRCVGVKFC